MPASGKLVSISAGQSEFSSFVIYTESYYCTGKDNSLVKYKTLEECKWNRIL